MTFNAWHDPWLPVVDRRGAFTQVSLRELYDRAPEFVGLGRGLSPLDIESLHRLMSAVAAVIVRGRPLRELTGSAQSGAFPADGVAAFEGRFADLFDLSGERPFLQRWDKSPADIDALVTSRKPLTDLLKPIAQMHPHEPGNSSAQWGVRRDPRDAADPAVLTMLLVTAWFHNRDGNSRDPWGGKAEKGSVATWTVNPMSVFLIDKNNLGRTIYANLPVEWVNGTDLPMFLDHHGVPEDFVTGERGLYRSTYARTVPLLYWRDGRAIGFVTGPMPYAVPRLAADIKESLKAVHLGDYAVLTVTRTTKAGSETKPRPSLGVRVVSTEGFERWFRADNGIAGASGALARWLERPRALLPDPTLAGWDVAVFSAICDTYGGRKWADWSVLPGRASGANPHQTAVMQSLTTFAAACRSKMLFPARIASGDSKTPAFLDQTQAAFYDAVEPILAAAAHNLAAGAPVDMWASLNQIATQARSAFHHGTEALRHHSLRSTSSARAVYARQLRGLLTSSPYRPDTTTVTSDDPSVPTPDADLTGAV